MPGIAPDALGVACLQACTCSGSLQRACVTNKPVAMGAAVLHDCVRGTGLGRRLTVIVASLSPDTLSLHNILQTTTRPPGRAAISRTLLELQTQSYKLSHGVCSATKSRLPRPQVLDSPIAEPPSLPLLPGPSPAQRHTQQELSRALVSSCGLTPLHISVHATTETASHDWSAVSGTVIYARSSWTMPCRLHASSESGP